MYRDTTLEDLVDGIACSRSSDGASSFPQGSEGLDGACVGVVYVWSELMPLSHDGIEEIAAAASQLGLGLRSLDASVLYHWQTEMDAAGRDALARSATDSLAEMLIVAGATVHFPATVVHRDGELLGPAILGYKTAVAYRDIIVRRLAGGELTDNDAAEAATSRSWSFPSRDGEERFTWRDRTVEGQPGAYFRWVPGTRSVAYEAGRQVFLLDLESGARLRAPGTIDFVPTPDGRLFVTPLRNRGGLEFYDAAAVWSAAVRGEGAGVQPIFTDWQMLDQYPSVGILRTGTSDQTVVYRVLTSWYDAVIYRDYEVSWPDDAGAVSVRPRGRPVPACSGRPISLPMLGPDGRELGARDETTGTTKLFELGAGGTCREVLDLGLPTGKVAFDREGQRVAFAVPDGAIRDGTGRPYAGAATREAAEQLVGIFVLDGDRRLLSRVPGSAEARRLAFPEFVADDGIAFLLADGSEVAARFRFVPWTVQSP